MATMRRARRAWHSIRAVQISLSSAKCWGKQSKNIVDDDCVPMTCMRGMILLFWSHADISSRWCASTEPYVLITCLILWVDWQWEQEAVSQRGLCHQPLSQPAALLDSSPRPFNQQWAHSPHKWEQTSASLPIHFVCVVESRASIHYQRKET